MSIVINFRQFFHCSKREFKDLTIKSPRLLSRYRCSCNSLCLSLTYFFAFCSDEFCIIPWQQLVLEEFSVAHTGAVRELGSLIQCMTSESSIPCLLYLVTATDMNIVPFLIPFFTLQIHNLLQVIWPLLWNFQRHIITIWYETDGCL